MAWNGPDEVLVTLEVRGEQEITNWALSMGANVEILEPESLRKQVRQILSSALKPYED